MGDEVRKGRGGGGLGGDGEGHDGVGSSSDLVQVSLRTSPERQGQRQRQGGCLCRGVLC